jgi:hypothetical protein
MEKMKLESNAALMRYAISRDLAEKY